MSDPIHAQHRFPWRTAILGVVAVVLGVLALIAYLRTLRQVEETTGAVADQVFAAGHYLVTNAPSIAATTAVVATRTRIT
jgi:hypothetical protein